MSTLRLARALAVYAAWWEDNDMWDGNAVYVDLDTAKTHAAWDYEGYEYGHPDEDDEEARPRPNLTWVEEHGSWHLMEDGKSTLVQVSETSIWRAATPREIEEQDALTAVEEAARAARPQLPMREALEALRPNREIATR